MSMLGSLVIDVALFALLAFVVGAACAPRWIAEPRLRLVTGTAFALGGTFLVGFGGFVSHLSNAATAAMAATAGVALVALRRHDVTALLRTAAVQEMFFGWLAFTGWSLGLLALVTTYSGGGWVADWVEHWQRTEFFTARQPLQTHFALIYSLTARPPLANVLVALFLAGAGANFAQYQVFLCLLGTLVLLPAWVIARGWRDQPSTSAWLLVVMMANPLVAQNLTFAWTKLPTAFFILTGAALALASVMGKPAHRLAVAAVFCLGFAMLTHYSAGPWIIALAAAWILCHRDRWHRAEFWREAAALTAVFIVIVAVWVAWSVTAYGWGEALASNTTAGEWQAQTAMQRLTTPGWNLIDTLVPFPIRGEPHDGLIDQVSHLGRIRDVAFNVYQVNLPLAVGLSGFWILATGMARFRRVTAVAGGGAQRFLQIAILLVVVLGVAVHTPRDEWGLAHICLQPLVVLGLAAVAALLPDASRAVRCFWAVLAIIDFTFGIVLHFGLESWAFARWIAPGAPAFTFLSRLSRSAVANANDKWAFHFQFVADRLHAPTALTALWLALCLGYAIVHTQRPAPTRR